MKKLIFLLAIMAFGMMAGAQSYTINGAPGQTYFKSLSDVTITNTTPVWLQVNASIDYPTTQHIIIDCDSVSGNHTEIALLLYGRNFENQAWTAISSTIVNPGVNSNIDNTLTNTTETRWIQFKVLLTGTGTGVSKIDSFEMKLYSPD